MSSDEHSLLEPYVLDAVDDIERHHFEKHLQECPTCRHELDSMRDALADLSCTVATPPPPQLRGQILTAARTAPQRNIHSDTEHETAQTRVPRLWGRRSVLVAAASIVVGGTGVGVWKATQPSISTPSAATIIGDPSAQRARTTYRGSRVTVARKNGFTAVQFEPTPPQVPGRVYTAWAADRSGSVRNAGQVPAVSGTVAIVLDGDTRPAQAVAFTTEKSGTHPSQPSSAALFTVNLS